MPRPVSALVDEDRRVLGEVEHLAGARDGLVDLLARQQVPLVEHDDHRAPALGRHAGDLRVLLGDALGGVDHEQHEIAALHGAHCLQDRQLLDALFLARLAANAGGVDQDVALVFLLEQGVDAVDGGAGAVIDELALLAEEAG